MFYWSTSIVVVLPYLYGVDCLMEANMYPVYAEIADKSNSLLKGVFSSRAIRFACRDGQDRIVFSTSVEQMIEAWLQGSKIEKTGSL